MRERMRVIELCAMAPQRLELAIQIRRHVICDRDFFGWNSELFRRDTPKVSFESGFRHPRNQIRIETPRDRRVQELWRVIRRQVIRQAPREGVRVAGYFARPG